MSIKDSLEDVAISGLVRLSTLFNRADKQRSMEDYNRVMGDVRLRQSVIDELCLFYHRFVMARIANIQEYCMCDTRAQEYMGKSQLYYRHKHYGINFADVCEDEPDSSIVSDELYRALETRFAFMPVIEKNIYTTIFYLNQYNVPFISVSYTEGHGLFKHWHTIRLSQIIENDPDFIFGSVTSQINLSYIRMRNNCPELQKKLSWMSEHMPGAIDELVEMYYTKEMIKLFFAKIIQLHDDLCVDGKNYKLWKDKNTDYAKKAKSESLGLSVSGDVIEFAAQEDLASRPVYPTLLTNFAWILENINEYGLLWDNGEILEPDIPSFLREHGVVHIKEMDSCILSAIDKFGDPIASIKDTQVRVNIIDAIFGKTIHDPWNLYKNAIHEEMVDDKENEMCFCRAPEMLLNYLWIYHKENFANLPNYLNLLYYPCI